MTTRKTDRRRTPRRGRGDDGAAVVEFAFIAILLFTLLFGIINFGLILSFKQDVTRAAAEGARGGAVAVPLVYGQTPKAAAEAAAAAATTEAVKGMGGKFATAPCTGAMHCASTVDTCAGQEGVVPPVLCVKVEISYDYEDKPLYGNLPIISAFLPDKVEATSVARINS